MPYARFRCANGRAIRLRALTLAELAEHGRDRAYANERLSEAAGALIGEDEHGQPCIPPGAEARLEPLAAFYSAWLDARVIRTAGGLSAEQMRALTPDDRARALETINTLISLAHGVEAATAAKARGEHRS